jgi:hypothetical protein
MPRQNVQPSAEKLAAVAELGDLLFKQVQSGRLKCQQLWGVGARISIFPTTEKETSYLYYMSESSLIVNAGGRSVMLLPVQ